MIKVNKSQVFTIKLTPVYDIYTVLQPPQEVQLLQIDQFQLTIYNNMEQKTGNQLKNEAKMHIF